MKLFKFKTLVAALAVITLMSTANFTYVVKATEIEMPQLENSVWKVTLETGNSLPLEQMKQWIEEKNGITLDEKDKIQMNWTKGQSLFEENKAIKPGKAFIKVRIKDVDEAGKCKTISQCIDITVTEKAEPIAHLPYINGYEDGTFRPERGITREELATMVGRLMLGGQKPLYQENFDDVSDARYSAPYIGYVTELGIMKSYEDGTFRPMEMVSEQEFNQVVQEINQYRGTDVSVTSVSQTNISRVESIILLNEIFGRECSDVEIKNMYSDIDENTFAYEDILYASIYHVHQ